MSPDDMADYHAHMAAWRKQQADEREGLTAAACLDAALEHCESARYWREKAKEND